MTDKPTFHLYAGKGETLAERGLELPLFDKPASLDDPASYLADVGLRNAVNVALALGDPLLLTGEAGCGKTQLAASIAHEFGLRPPLVFNAKSTSTARDLFYRYDSLRHFHDIQVRQAEKGGEAGEARGRPISVLDYIDFEALGLAVLLSKPSAEVEGYLRPELAGGGPCRSVVLIDEIDKAPRDLPNDLLNEIASMEFTVRETGMSFKAELKYRPIVILTSNSEKNLPDAFMRRCVFYHIEFPKAERLREIVTRRIELSSGFTPQMLDAAIARFEEIREMRLKKKPATAELIAWVRILDRLGLDVSDAGAREAVAFTYAALVKNSEDRETLQNREF